MSTRVVLDRRAAQQMLTGRNAPVARFLRAGGRRWANAAKVRCPVDTGRLRASVDSAVTVRPPQVRLLVGSDVEYAAAVHEGYVVRGRTRVTRVRPRPFIRDAGEQVLGVRFG